MLEAIARTLEHDRRANLGLARQIPEAVCGRLPAGLAQSPCWIICHLCLADTRQHGSLTVGRPGGDDDGFFGDFGPTSDIAAAGVRMRARFGSWHGAIEAAAASHARLVSAIRQADPERLARPHPNERVRDWFPTLADNITYALWHEGNHGGQLRAWMHAARCAGLLETS